MGRGMCIIKAQFGKADKIRVYFYEISKKHEGIEDVDDFNVDLYYTPYSRNSYATSLPISCVEVVSQDKVEFVDNVLYYVGSKAV